MSGFDLFCSAIFLKQLSKNMSLHYNTLSRLWIRFCSHFLCESWESVNIRFHRTDYQADNSLYSIRACYILHNLGGLITDSKLQLCFRLHGRLWDIRIENCFSSLNEAFPWETTQRRQGLVNSLWWPILNLGPKAHHSVTFLSTWYTGCNLVPSHCSLDVRQSPNHFSSNHTDVLRFCSTIITIEMFYWHGLFPFEHTLASYSWTLYNYLESGDMTMHLLLTNGTQQ